MNRKAVCSLALLAVAAATFAIGTPARASATDDQIKSAFNQSYVYRVYLKDDAVKVESKDGVVTLRGTVAEESHKAMAEDTAANLPGVTRVDNQLATPAEIAADNADTWIGRKVKLALLFHRHVKGRGTDVSVTDGIVTLRGIASSTAQKELTSEYASDIEGVKEVRNEMTVAASPETTERTMGEKIDDASITAQVKMALFTHRSTSAIKTTVPTRDGEVTLTGIAKNDAEKSLVTKLVEDLQGVNGVKNQMTVAELQTK